MRLVSFVQVLLLLIITVYLVLVTLENPTLVHLPLPLGRGEIILSVGLTVTLFSVIGAMYASLLILPPMINERLRRNRASKEKQAVEERLTATLQARLGAAAVPLSSVVDSPLRDLGRNKPMLATKQTMITVNKTLILEAEPVSDSQLVVDKNTEPQNTETQNLETQNLETQNLDKSGAL